MKQQNKLRPAVLINGAVLTRQSVYSNQITLAKNTTITSPDNSYNVLTGTIVSPSYSLTFNGTGVILIQGITSTTLGGITVNSGKVNLNRGGFLGGITHGGLTVNGPGKVELIGGAGVINPVDPNYAVNINAGATLIVSGMTTQDTSGYYYTINMVGATNNPAAITSPDGSNIRFGSYSSSVINSSGVAGYPNIININIMLVNGSAKTFTFNVSSGQLNVKNPITDYPGLSGTPVFQTGAGTLVLSGTNTYSGTTTISGGEYRLQGSAASSAHIVAAAAAITPGYGTISTIGALAFSASNTYLNAYPTSASGFALLVCSSLSCPSGFTVAFKGGYTLAAGPYNLIKVTSTTAPTLGTVNAVGLGNIGRTGALFSVTGSAGAWFITVTLT